MLMPLATGSKSVVGKVTLKKGRKNVGHLHVRVAHSDVERNATIALKNLLASLGVGDYDEWKIKDGKLEGFIETSGSFLEATKHAMSSHLSEAIQNNFATVDAWITFVDDIAKVSQIYCLIQRVTYFYRKAHPLLNVGWRLTTVLYKVPFYVLSACW